MEAKLMSGRELESLEMGTSVNILKFVVGYNVQSDSPLLCVHITDYPTN